MILGFSVQRVVTEPTAAALAYGLHKKEGVEYIVVVDLGKIFLSIIKSIISNAWKINLKFLLINSLPSSHCVYRLFVLV